MNIRNRNENKREFNFDPETGLDDQLTQGKFKDIKYI